MTYCVGWIFGDSVFLIADSAVTSDSPITSRQRSNFDELHYQTKKGYVQEALLKLAPIAPDVAVAYAGVVARAASMVRFLRENYRPSQSV